MKYNWIFSVFFIDFPELTLDFQRTIAFLLVGKKHKVWVFIFLIDLKEHFGKKSVKIC